MMKVSDKLTELDDDMWSALQLEGNNITGVAQSP